MIRGVPYDHQLEYIESTGSQWIDTGIKPSLDLVAKIKLCNLAATGDVIFGFAPSPWGTAADSKDWRMFNAGSTLYFDILAGKRINGTSFVKGVWREFELGNYYVKDLSTGQVLISGTAATDSTPYGNNTYTITLNRAQGLGTMSLNRWAYVKIYRGETLVQDLIPVSVNGVAMMYDRVTGTFPKHYGTFVAGPVASTPLMGVHMYQDNYTSYDYIQDSAFFVLDGIENVGRGKHGNEFSGWHELTRGRAVFPRPLNSVWTKNGLRQDGVYSDYIGNNPGTYQSFVQNVDVAYPEIVTSRSNMVMTAEFVFEITGFTEAQRTADGRQYFPFAGLGFLKYTEYNYSIWGIGQDGRIIINPAAAWNAGAYALRSTDTVDPIGKHCITLVLDGVDSTTGKFKGAIYHNGVAMRLTQPTNSSTYAPFKHSDNTQPYTIRLNTATSNGWTFLGTAYANRLHSRALTAAEAAYNFKVDNSRYKIIGA